MVFCEVSKAFYRVWHKGLIFKLRQHGIDGDLLNWISDYLHDRKPRVVIRSCMSDFKRVNVGVPQGSVLGSLLFLIYVNDISESLLSLTRLFADDSSITKTRLYNFDPFKPHFYIVILHYFSYLAKKT